MAHVALFPGSFDPFTLGHDDIVRRGLKMFDKIVISIGHNTSKNNRYFDIDDTVEGLKTLYAEFNPTFQHQRVQIVQYNELTADLARKYDAEFLLRGLLNTTDFEYENSISQVNRNLNDRLETVLLITSPNVAWISSSIVREIHKHHGDISRYLPFVPQLKHVIKL